VDETETLTRQLVTFDLPSGRLSGCRWGDPRDPLVVCVPGLSQDERSFDRLGPALAGAGHQVVALAPRGRGRSSVTPPGTYGWPSHAADVLATADVLGVDRFDYVGWSFGAFVGMQVATDAPARLRSLVLLDALGRPEPSALGPVMAGLERLGTVHRDADAYVTGALAGGGMDGCRAAWEGYLADDLERVDGGFRTRTDRDAVLEDAAHGGSRDPYELWASLTMPVLVLRASRPIEPGLGFIVTESDRDRFPAMVPNGRVVDVDANHYCIGMVPAAATLIEEFLHA
jgi:pimeloyl-ACP methyl ester carboxylesterase